MAMGLQGVQELVSGVSGCFFQLITIQNLQDHLCHGCQHSIAHHVILREGKRIGLRHCTPVLTLLPQTLEPVQAQRSGKALS